MKFFKKLLVLAAIPASVLATGNEKIKDPFLREGRLLRKPLPILGEALDMPHSKYRSREYNYKVFSALNRSEIKYNNEYKEMQLDLTELESVITEEAQKPCNEKIERLGRECDAFRNEYIKLDKQVNHFKNHIPKIRIRAFGLGALTGILAVSAFIKIKSSIPTIFWHRT